MSDLAVVTGATGGLGRACAHAFARSGARVALVSRSRERLEALARALGDRAEAVPCDVTDGAQVRAAFAALAPPAVLVACAGGNRPEPFLEVGEEALEWSWRLNVRGAFLTAQAAAARMVGRGGAIVFVTSQMGHVGAPRRTAYCAAKHAVEGLTKAMAVELAPHGIRVNAVAPTFVETPMTQAFDESPDEWRAQIPLGRLGTADEVADAVLFAARSTLMTGASLRVDGGWTAR
ncbi:MAG TPA: SDR family oxidoreductase [Solirubrobacteraceae bacterium]|nr:SDR family oxidoreductase [Solirubrobacteraceae bacterium]